MTANDRYRGLHAFSKWLEAEEDFVHPMRKLKPPKVPDQPVPVIGKSELERLLAVCATRTSRPPRQALPGPRVTLDRSVDGRLPSSAVQVDCAVGIDGELGAVDGKAAMGQPVVAALVEEVP